MKSPIGWAVLSLILGGLVTLGLGSQLPAPAGSDPDLWVLSALNLSVGVPSVVPPLMPTLLRPLLAFGVPGPVAAQGLSMASHALLGGVVLAATQRLGGTLKTGLLAGLLAVALPSVAVLSVRAQPDALVALWSVGATGMAGAWVQRPRPLARHRGLFLVLLLVAVCGVLLRVHGMIGALLLVGVAGLGGGRLFRLGRVLVGALGLHLAPLLLGLWPGLLWKLPWTRRLMATAVSGELVGLPEEVARTVSEQGTEVLSLPAQLAWVVEQAPGSWAWVATGLLAVLALAREDRRRIVLAVGVLPALPALFTWGQPRHVAVVVPVCVMVWVLAVRHHRGWILPGLAALGLSIVQAPSDWERLESEATMVDDLRTLGTELCEQVSPGDLGAGVRAMFLYCPLPVHLPDGSGADWKTWAVGRRPLGPGWQRVDLGGHRVYRLEPTRVDSARPCAASLPAADTPYFGTPDVAARLSPACDGPERAWRQPKPPAKAPEKSAVESRRRRPGARR